jgi:coiled-coil domain-containing protein 55
MKAAALRQMEFERRQDRKIQKEREDEGDLFSDKESFVTEAYRQRMEERQRLDEEERNQDQIEGRFVFIEF